MNDGGMSDNGMNDDDDGRACNLPSGSLPEENNFLSLIGGKGTLMFNNVIDLYLFIHLMKGKRKEQKELVT